MLLMDLKFSLNLCLFLVRFVNPTKLFCNLYTLRSFVVCVCACVLLYYLKF